MKAEILEPTSSPPSSEVNYKVPAPSSSAPARPWRSIAASLGVLVLVTSYGIVAIGLHSHASPSSTPSTSAGSTESNPWNALGYVDSEGGITPLYPLQMGRVKSISAKENQLVEEGAPLLELDDSVPRLNVREAELDLEGAQKQLAIAQAGVEEADKQIVAQKTAIALAQKNVELARINRDKQKNFVEKGIEGDKETLQAAEISLIKAELGVQGEQEKLLFMEAAKHRAEALVGAAKVRIEGKKVQLDKARHALNECVLRAPAQGWPLRIHASVGETLGANPRQPAIQFAANRPLLVRAEVEQEFVGRVKLNQDVSIEDSVTEKEIAKGKVANIARWYAPRRSINTEILPPTNDTRTVECIIPIKSPSPEIRIGQRVRLKFRD